MILHVNLGQHDVWGCFGGAFLLRSKPRILNFLLRCGRTVLRADLLRMQEGNDKSNVVGVLLWVAT